VGGKEKKTSCPFVVKKGKKKERSVNLFKLMRKKKKSQIPCTVCNKKKKGERVSSNRPRRGAGEGKKGGESKWSSHLFLFPRGGEG